MMGQGQQSMMSQGQVITSIGMGGGGTATMVPNARMQGRVNQVVEFNDSSHLCMYTKI